jgi:hypothetical protein
MVSIALMSMLAGAPLAQQPEPGPVQAVVVADVLDVYAEPDEAAFATLRLRRGERVTVVDERGDGWLGIEPPAGSVSWVDHAALEPAGGGETRVEAEQAVVRAGNPKARMPGPPVATLVNGEVVRLADYPALTLVQGRTRRTWQAIEPTAGEVRYVRQDGVELTGASAQAREEVESEAPPNRPRRMSRVSRTLGAVDPGLLVVGSTGGEPTLSPQLAATLNHVETTHRAALRMPVDEWDLAGVRQQYERLLESETDAAGRTAIRARLAQLDRQEAAAKAARSLRDLLTKSRRLDLNAARKPTGQGNSTKAEDSPFDAVGLLQRSSKQVDGQKVFALIDREGKTTAYLSVPPGLDTNPLVTRRVGIRGRTRFNEALNTYLIQVTQIEPLNSPP